MNPSALSWTVAMEQLWTEKVFCELTYGHTWALLHIYTAFRSEWILPNYAESSIVWHVLFLLCLNFLNGRKLNKRKHIFSSDINKINPASIQAQLMVISSTAHVGFFGNKKCFAIALHGLFFKKASESSLSYRNIPSEYGVDQVFLNQIRSHSKRN